MATTAPDAYAVMYFKVRDSWVRFQRDGSELLTLDNDEVSGELVGYGFRDLSSGKLDKMPGTAILQLMHYPTARHLFFVE